MAACTPGPTLPEGTVTVSLVPSIVPDHAEHVAAVVEHHDHAVAAGENGDIEVEQRSGAGPHRCRSVGHAALGRAGGRALDRDGLVVGPARGQGPEVDLRALREGDRLLFGLRP